jgi:aspartate dehydrogenase
MKSVGIVGLGAIGRAIVRAVEAGQLNVEVAGVTSRSAEKARAYLSTLASPPSYVDDLDELISRSDIIVEAAGPHSVASLAERTFAQGKDLVVISVGALLDRMDLFDLAREKGCRLIVPSGAIAGLDAVKAACIGQVDYVRLTSRKAPRALEGAPFLKENGISLDGLAEERLLFTGPARLAVKGFPDNLNISAALSLAGIGPDRTQVSITAVPGLTRNCHLVEVEGEFGKLEIRIENIPSENPKTGRLTAMSIVKELQQAVDVVRVGT